MKICLEILESAFVCGVKEIETLNTKALVPKMMTRRRLTPASKIAIYLANEVHFKEGKIMYGTQFGELPATVNILNAINEKETISPTHFQNSGYNTAVSYLSMLYENTHEIMTFSSGEKTSLNVLKAGAIKALEGDEILLLCIETLNIPQLQHNTSCLDFLEAGVALKVKYSHQAPTLKRETLTLIKGLPASLQEIFAIAQYSKDNNATIMEVSL